MSKKFSVKELADFIRSLKKSASEDEQFSIAWFNGTKDEHFSIIGGWMNLGTEEYADLFCSSASDPSYVMSVKIVINEGPYAYTDFEVMNMPVDSNGEVDDTCIALEHSDDPEYVAQFFLDEWERIMKAHVEGNLT